LFRTSASCEACSEAASNQTNNKTVASLRTT
jgi:hypothetical protein